MRYTKVRAYEKSAQTNTVRFQYGYVLFEAILSDLLRPNIVFHRRLREVEVHGQEIRRKVFVLTKQRVNDDAKVTTGLQRDITKR